MKASLLYQLGLVLLGLSLMGACTVSAEITQIAYIKASNTGDGDNFGAGGTIEGDAVALSKDGSTLAVGAPFEGKNIVVCRKGAAVGPLHIRPEVKIPGVAVRPCLPGHCAGGRQFVILIHPDQRL